MEGHLNKKSLKMMKDKRKREIRRQQRKKGTSKGRRVEDVIGCFLYSTFFLTLTTKEKSE